MSFNDFAKKEILKERKVIIHVVGGVAEVFDCPDDVEIEIIDFDNLKED